MFTTEAGTIFIDFSYMIRKYIVEKLEAGKSPKSILKKLKKKINLAYKNSFEEDSCKYLPKAFHENVNKYIDKDDGLCQLYFESDILLLLKLEFHSVKTRLNTDISATGSAKIFIEEYKEDLKIKK